MLESDIFVFAWHTIRRLVIHFAVFGAPCHDDSMPDGLGHTLSGEMGDIILIIMFALCASWGVAEIMNIYDFWFCIQTKKMYVHQELYQSRKKINYETHHQHCNGNIRRELHL